MTTINYYSTKLMGPCWLGTGVQKYRQIFIAHTSVDQTPFLTFLRTNGFCKIEVLVQKKVRKKCNFLVKIEKEEFSLMKLLPDDKVNIKVTIVYVYNLAPSEI